MDVVVTKYIEDVISTEDFKKIEDLVFCNSFPWYYESGTVSDGYGKDSLYWDTGINVPQFSHYLINETGLVSLQSSILLIVPMIARLEEIIGKQLVIHRCKFNYLSQYNDETHHYPHIDGDEKEFSFVYYINDSDGPTYFFDNKKNINQLIKPKKNCGVLFKSNVIHSSSSPICSKNRIVLNTVFSVKPQLSSLPATKISNLTTTGL